MSPNHRTGLFMPDVNSVVNASKICECVDKVQKDKQVKTWEYFTAATPIAIDEKIDCKDFLYGVHFATTRSKIPKFTKTETNDRTPSTPDFCMTSHVKVTNIDGNKGRGVIAKKNMKAGTIILAEKPCLGILNAEAKKKFSKWGDKFSTNNTLPLACGFTKNTTTAKSKKCQPYYHTVALSAVMSALYPFGMSDIECEKNSNEDSCSDVETNEDSENTSENCEDSKSEQNSDGEDMEGYSTNPETNSIVIKQDVEKYMRPLIEPVSEFLNNGSNGSKKLLSLDDVSMLLGKKVGYNAFVFSPTADPLPDARKRSSTTSKNATSISGQGLYLLGALFNHSCAPNLRKYFIGDIAFYILENDVKANEELCHSYIGEGCLEDLEARATLLGDRNFECHCVNCTFEGNDNESKTNDSDDEVLRLDIADLRGSVDAMRKESSAKDTVKYIQSILDGDCPDFPEDEIVAPLRIAEERELRMMQISIEVESRDFKAAEKSILNLIKWIEKISKNDESAPTYHVILALCLLAKTQCENRNDDGDVNHASTRSSTKSTAASVSDEPGAKRRRITTKNSSNINKTNLSTVDKRIAAALAVSETVFGFGGQEFLMALYREVVKYWCEQKFFPGDSKKAAKLVNGFWERVDK